MYSMHQEIVCLDDKPDKNSETFYIVNLQQTAAVSYFTVRIGIRDRLNVDRRENVDYSPNYRDLGAKYCRTTKTNLNILLFNMLHAAS